MRLQVVPYVTVGIDERLRRRLRRAGERLRVNVRAYLLSGADDVDAAGGRGRGRQILNQAVAASDAAVVGARHRYTDEQPDHAYDQSDRPHQQNQPSQFHVLIYAQSVGFETM